ncbi:MAG: mechanosensitive ion channel family protein [Anaerolineales bacterium]
MENFLNEWGGAVIASLTAALTVFLAAIPRIFGFLLILIIGWFISSLLAGALAAGLRVIRFNELAQRSGFTGFVQKMGIRRDGATVLADVAKWFVRLIVLVVAFDALGLPAVSQVLQQLLLWLPNAVVAIVILVIGGLVANALGDLVRGATAQAQLGNSELLSTLVRMLIWGFAIVVAVNQIGVATTLVNTLFMAFVGALALALGLAFGLGGRDTAAEIVRGWYQRSREAMPRLERAADVAQAQAASRMEQTRRSMAPNPTSGD